MRSTFTILVILLITTSSLTSSYDVTIGHRHPHAEIIVHSLETSNGAPDYVLTYSRTYTGDNYREISQVNIIDEVPFAGMRYAALVAGGPGYTYATITYTVGRHTRMRYNITIYGRPPPFRKIP